MAGDEVGGNNVMECDANNRNNVGTSGTNNDKNIIIMWKYLLGNNG